MASRSAAVLTLLSSFLVPTSLLAKSPTILIEVSGKPLVSPIRITDPKFLDAYSFFNGPGVTDFSGEAYAKGSIVDWKAGPVVPVSNERQHYEVRVYWGPRTMARCLLEAPCLVYVAFYDYDPSSKRGFVYLPGRGEPWHDMDINPLYHGSGVEGHWYRALDSWTNSVRLLIAGVAGRKGPRP
jgi:hypothetical protein